MSVTEQETGPLGGGVRRERRHQEALTDPRFPDHGDDVSLAARRSLEGRFENSQFGAAPGQRARAGQPVERGREGRGGLGGRAAERRSAEDALIEVARLRLGLCAELALERGDARLVLAERRRPAPTPRVETHERAVRGLLQRIEREQPERGLDRPLVVALPAPVGQQPRLDLNGQLP